MVRQDDRQRYANAAKALQAIIGLYQPNVTTTAVSLPAASGTNATVKANQSSLMSRIKWNRGDRLGLAGVIVGTVGVITAAFTVPEVREFIGLDRAKNSLDRDNGIILQYPGNWELPEINQPVVGDRAVFKSPKQDPSDPYQENITWTVIDLPQPLSKEQYYQQDLRPQLEREYNIKLVSNPNSTTLDNRDANTVIYTIKEGEIELKRQAIWTVKNGTVYQLTYSGEVANFPTDQQVIKKVQDSFKIP